MKRITKIALLGGAAFGLVYFGIDHDVFAQTTRDFWGNRIRRAPRFEPPNLAYLRFAAITASGMVGICLWLVYVAKGGRIPQISNTICCRPSHSNGCFG